MEKRDKTKAYDFVIIGAGVAGLSAAMYGARLGMKTLVLGASLGSEMPIGGIITTTNSVENYPGFAHISGVELAEKIRKQAESYKTVTIKNEMAESVKSDGKEFAVESSKGKYKGKTILFATGGMWRKLNVPGSKNFENKGIAYCALCDAPLFKNKTVAVVGGSDVAVKDALVLAEHAKKVFIIYRGEKLRAEQVTLEKVESNKKIEVITKTNIIEVKGENSIKSVVLDNAYNGSKELEVQGIFVAIGHEPLSEIAEKIGVKTNEKGEIIINHNSAETNVGGVYAAGDVTDNKFKQVIIGVAEGCMAARSAYEFLKK